MTREELQKRVWPSNTFVDFDHGLNTAVKELRSALSDSASEPRYIETLPKMGYRLIVPVESEAGVAEPAIPERAPETGSAQPMAEESNAGLSDSATLASRPWIVMLILTTVAFVSLVVFVKWLRTQPVTEKPATKSRKMLAVLPFENLTGMRCRIISVMA